MMTLKDAAQLEREVAEFLLTTETNSDNNETVSQHFKLGASWFGDPSIWRSRLRPPGGYENKRGVMKRKHYGKVAYWQTDHYAPEFDLLFDMQDVPFGSLLSKMLFDPEASFSTEQLAKSVSKKAYITVEVKSSEHVHWSSDNAAYDTFPAEFLSDEVQASGFSLTEADLVVAAVRSFCLDETCEYERCGQNRAAAPPDPRHNFVYYVLPMTNWRSLVVETLTSRSTRRPHVIASRSNGALCAPIPLEDMFETMLTKKDALHYAEVWSARKSKQPA